MYLIGNTQLSVGDGTIIGAINEINTGLGHAINIFTNIPGSEDDIADALSTKFKDVPVGFGLFGFYNQSNGYFGTYFKHGIDTVEATFTSVNGWSYVFTCLSGVTSMTKSNLLVLSGGAASVGAAFVGHAGYSVKNCICYVTMTLTPTRQVQNGDIVISNLPPAHNDGFLLYLGLTATNGSSYSARFISGNSSAQVEIYYPDYVFPSRIDFAFCYPV